MSRLDSLAGRLVRDAADTVSILCAPPGFGKRSLAAALLEAGADHLVEDDDVRTGTADGFVNGLGATIGPGAVVVTSRPQVARLLRLELGTRCKLVTTEDLRLDRPALASLIGRTPDDPIVADLDRLAGGHPEGSRIIATGGRLAWRMLGIEQRATEDIAQFFEALCGSFYDAEELDLLSGLAARTTIRSDDETDEVMLACLANLAARGAFVSATMTLQPTFEIEPLFAHFLAMRALGRSQMVTGDTLQRLARAGEVVGAFDAAMRFGDASLAAEVVAAAGGLKLLFRTGALALPMLERLPSNPCALGTALGAKIFAALQGGRYAVATTLLDMHDNVPGRPADDLEMMLIRWIVQLNHGAPPGIGIVDAGRRRHLLELLSDSVLHATQLLLGGAACCAVGRYQAAKDQLAAALSLIRAEDCPLLEHHCLMYSAIALARAGHIQRAEAEARQAWRGLAASLGPETAQTAYAALVLARLLQEQGRYEDADRLVPSALWCIDMMVNWADGAEFAIEAAVSWMTRTRSFEETSRFLHDRRAAAAGGAGLTGSPLRIAVLQFRHAMLAGAAEATLRSVLQGFGDPGVQTGMDGDMLRLSICFRHLEVGQTGNDTLRGELDTLRAVAIANGDMFCLFDILKMCLDVERGKAIECWREREADLISHAETCGFVDRLAAASAGAAAPGSLDHSGLTRREQQVLACLGNGMSSKEIALSLDIAFGTVKGYRREIYRKLGISRRSQAVAAARDLHI